MKPQIFRDTEIQKRFNEDGFVVIDFMSAEDASGIAQKFYEIHPVLPKGFYADAFNPDDTIKQEIFLHSDKTFQKIIDEKFQEYKKLGSTFLCKAHGEDGMVNVHQDWTTVDETHYYSATIWVPTVDTTDENGALRVLPGSHLFFNNYRSNNIPIAYKGSEKLLWDNMITIPMKAGQALVLNHAILHGSSPNTTKKERLVIAYGLIPQDAKLFFYHKDKNVENGRIEKFEMPDDFFQRYYNVGERPLFGNMVNDFDYTVVVKSSTEIEELIEREIDKRRGVPFFRDNWIKNKKAILHSGSGCGLLKKAFDFLRQTHES